MKKIYNKLVRDRIPEIIKASGKKCTYRTLNQKEFELALFDKMIEEIKELKEAFIKSNGEITPEVLGEFADYREVENYIFKTIDKENTLFEYFYISSHKREYKGSFEKKFFLISVEE